MPKYKLTKDDLRSIHAAHRAHFTPTEIAKAFGLSHSTVFHAINKRKSKEIYKNERGLMSCTRVLKQKKIIFLKWWKYGNQFSFY